MTIATASSTHGMLPTIVSRCQAIRPIPLGSKEIESILIRDHGFEPEQAVLASSISRGWLDVALTLDRGFLGEVRRFLTNAMIDVHPRNNLELSARLRQLCLDTGDSKQHLRIQVAHAVEMIRFLWRDALTYKTIGRNDQDPTARSVARERSATKLTNDLSALGSAVASLRAGVNVDLVLDNMFMTIAAAPTNER